METAGKQVVVICDEDGEHSAAEQENLHCQAQCCQCVRPEDREHSAAEQENLHCQAVCCQCVRPQSASHESANHTTPQDQRSWVNVSP